MRQRESFEFWGALVILGVVAAMAYRSIDSASATLGWVEHTHRVLQQFEDVSNAYARAASARRAYAIAGDESQLTDLANIDARMTQSLAAAKLLVADNPSQLQRVDSLGLLLGQRLAALDELVAQRRRGGSGAETADGLAVVARIRDAREEMSTVENQLLATRYARTQSDVTRTKLAEVVGTFASFGILLLAFRRLRQEITRRRQSEEALRASETFLDSIVENIPDMIFVKEARELRFERINRAGEELLGVDRRELLHKNDFDFFPGPQAEAFQARDRETLAGRVVVDVLEEPIETKTGPRWLHTKKVPIVDANGNPSYLLGISEDITERRRVAEELKAARDAAVSANRELEAFSYTVAHDLRAPLRAIDGFSMALEEDYAGKLDADGRGHLSRVRASAQQMAQLIDGLLELSRVTRGEVVRSRVDLSRLVEQAVTRLRGADPKREVNVVVTPELVVEGDARLLAAAIDNLIGNAWKFTGKCPQPRIEVGKLPKEGERVFFIRDNGAGFEQAYAAKLFGPFQRLHTATEFEGTGIGLATVERIIRRHGGRIWAEGEVGRGATFYFTL